MNVLKAKNYEEMGVLAGDLIAKEIKGNKNVVLGLATGSTPISTYDRLVSLYDKGEIDFSNVKSVNLDEYVGLEATHDQSYRYFMNQNLFNRVNINLDNTNVPNGMSSNIEKECSTYEKLIDELGGVDIQILGIGFNGHIGFNEPSDFFQKQTSRVDLTQSTIDANKRFFESADQVPKQAISMGIKTIMKSKKILLLASGEGKADIINQAINGPITPQVPASVLQLHPDVTVIVDDQAGKLV